MSERPSTVTLTIDGQKVTVPKGTTVYHAAERLGIEIPIFCYHDRMPPLGACRMCFVRVDGMARLQTACTLEAQDGMVVHTESPDVVEARQAILEFLLINHPLDCPICDKGGECPLQDNTFKYGPGISRFVEPKRHFPKSVPLSPVLTLDRERCIMCWRCTRFGEIIAGDHALKGHERGYLTHIDVPPITMERPSKFIGNTIAICPVGALTSGVYRFRSRPWNNRAVPSVCNHCGVGCAMTLDVRGGEVVRTRARENTAINDVWMCDVGFFGYDYINRPDRLHSPYVRDGAGLREATWAEALDVVASHLRGAAPQTIGAVGGERLTLEESYLLSRLFRSLGSNNLDSRCDTLYAPPTRDWAWGMEGAIDRIDRASVIVLVGCDLSEEYPVVWLRAKRAADRGGRIVALAPKRLEISPYCSPAILHNYGWEDRLVWALVRLCAERKGEAATHALDAVDVDATAAGSGVPRPVLESVAAALAAGGEAVFLVGRMALEGPVATGVLEAVNTLRAVSGGTLSLMRGRGSAAAAAVAGMVPDCLPGLSALDDPDARRRVQGTWGIAVPERPGLGTPQMLDAAAQGGISVLYLAGADLARDFPDRDLWRRARHRLGLLVVTDLFWTDTAQQADVVLPALTFAEKGGTAGNIEARPQRIQQATVGPSGAWADLTIIQALADRLGFPLAYATVGEIWEEMQQVIPGLAEGEPYPLPRRPARVEAPSAAPGDPLPPGEGLVVVPWTPLFRRGTMASRCRGLPDLAGAPRATLHPDDAGRVGVLSGDEVELAVDGQAARLTAHIAPDVLPGHVLVPLGFEEVPAAEWRLAGRVVRASVRVLQRTRQA
ncbi:MAG: NADH-quinone oxidoreductase subunit NuoG [Armatimonadota bacterium]|nr:NADH-quinone oxidoreductase subunit NuoG [Armatimonadota bacterium]